MSYWEIYRADLDPLARYYPARPHDTGIHLLIGGVVDRGAASAAPLLRAVADLVLDQRPACTRVVAEPDIRNTPSVAAFLRAGFRFSAEADLPAKRAALMVRDRPLRHLLYAVSPRHHSWTPPAPNAVPARHANLLSDCRHGHLRAARHGLVPRSSAMTSLAQLRRHRPWARSSDHGLVPA